MKILLLYKQHTHTLARRSKPVIGKKMTQYKIDKREDKLCSRISNFIMKDFVRNFPNGMIRYHYKDTKYEDNCCRINRIMFFEIYPDNIITTLKYLGWKKYIEQIKLRNISDILTMFIPLTISPYKNIKIKYKERIGKLFIES